MKSNKKLTPKQRSFIDNYLANGGNGTQAAKDAGYKGSPNTLKSVAQENLRKPDIAEKIEAAQNKLKEDLGFTAEWKRERLGQVIERSLQAEKVYEIINGEKVFSGEYQFKGDTVIRAIAELNKMDGDHAALKIKADIKTTVDHVSILEKARARAKSKTITEDSTE